MGQISTKIYQKACIWDFSVSGGAPGSPIDMGIAMNGGETLIQIYYTAISALVTADLNVNAGFAFLGSTGFVSHTVAQINAAIGAWLIPTPPAGFPFKIAVGSTSNTIINFLPGAGGLTGGKMLFSFTVMSHPL